MNKKTPHMKAQLKNGFLGFLSNSRSYVFKYLPSWPELKLPLKFYEAAVDLCKFY